MQGETNKKNFLFSAKGNQVGYSHPKPAESPEVKLEKQPRVKLYCSIEVSIGEIGP